MGYENIQFKYDHMTGEDGYFYQFDHTVSNLIVKTDDGSIAFTYPLDTDISANGEVQAVEFDGFNFWTLQNPGGSIVIRQWQLENYVCIQQAGFPKIYTDDVSETWDANAMTVEHYHLEFSTLESPAVPNSIISVRDSEGILTGSIDDVAKNPMLIYLGPSTHGNNPGVTEAHTVQTSSSNSITLNSNYTYYYNEDDPVTLVSYVWLFNNLYETNDLEGGLYRFHSNGLGISAKWGGAEYDNTYACTFSSIPAGTFVDPAAAIYALCYVDSANLLFKQVGEITDPNYLNNYGSMIMDNVNDEGTSIYIVYDMFIYNLNVYRLQQYATYYESDQNWGTLRNYQLATLEPFVHSISLQASPAVIPADNASTSTITAVVKSQFLEPIVARTVTFTEDDGVGEVFPLTNATDSDGVATTVYTSGTAAREVTITATAVQT